MKKDGFSETCSVVCKIPKNVLAKYGFREDGSVIDSNVAEDIEMGTQEDDSST